MTENIVYEFAIMLFSTIMDGYSFFVGHLQTFIISGISLIILSIFWISFFYIAESVYFVFIRLAKRRKIAVLKEKFPVEGDIINFAQITHRLNPSDYEIALCNISQTETLRNFIAKNGGILFGEILSEEQGQKVPDSYELVICVFPPGSKRVVTKEGEDEKESILLEDDIIITFSPTPFSHPLRSIQIHVSSNSSFYLMRHIT